MTPATPSGFSPRRGVLRSLLMNAALMALLAAVFIWSAAGNAIEHILGAARG